uniref:Uncharacterized protein n=1 Tax=Salix viminalis TaxID=40686 RepID=A0A6N2N894_SALVM
MFSPLQVTSIGNNRIRSQVNLLDLSLNTKKRGDQWEKLTEESEHTEAYLYKSIPLLLRAHFSFCQLPEPDSGLFFAPETPFFLILSPLLTNPKKKAPEDEDGGAEAARQAIRRSTQLSRSRQNIGHHQDYVSLWAFNCFRDLMVMIHGFHCLYQQDTLRPKTTGFLRGAQIRL